MRMITAASMIRTNRYDRQGWLMAPLPTPQLALTSGLLGRLNSPWA